MVRDFRKILKELRMERIENEMKVAFDFLSFKENKHQKYY